MVREYYQNIEKGVQIRANLIALRGELKEEKNRRALASLIGGDFTQLEELLSDEDPKIRKNAALILGEMESEDLLPVLFDAYKKEKTLYIRADYLKAISRLEYRPALNAFRQRLEQLRNMEIPAEEQKHISEEMRMLQSMVTKYETNGPHRFTGYKAKKELLLVTNRCQREVTLRQVQEAVSPARQKPGETRRENVSAPRQIPGVEITMLAGGLRINGAAVGDVLPIRTYSELLFSLENRASQKADGADGSNRAPQETNAFRIDRPAETGEKLAPLMLAMARELHEGEPPFLFRIELKGHIEPQKKGAYVRKIADAIEKASKGSLTNSVTDYELELRLLERRNGTFAPMLKLFTIPEKRFAYRKQYIASSIAPVNAALAAYLAKPYMKPGARVLDPFCGVGTMLIERQRAVPAQTMYGVDIFGEAIEKARENTKRAGERIFYINRDFFSFEHEDKFDEIITDMPLRAAGGGPEDLRGLYRAFFEKAGRHLADNGVMILYSAEPKLISEALGVHRGYRLTKRFLFNEKNGAGVFVIVRRSK